MYSYVAGRGAGAAVAASAHEKGVIKVTLPECKVFLANLEADLDGSIAIFCDSNFDALDLNGTAAITGEWLGRFAENLSQQELQHQTVAGVRLLNTLRDKSVYLLLAELVTELSAIGYARLSSCPWSGSAVISCHIEKNEK